MSDLATLAAKDDIAACIYTLFISTDQRNWAKVRGCFADSVHFDMTSLAGGNPVKLTPKEIARAWESGLKSIEHVHHQAGNLQISVDGDKATAFCYGIALHYKKTKSGKDVRRFVGGYDFGLEKNSGRGWVIRAFRFDVKFVDGNRELDKSP